MLAKCYSGALYGVNAQTVEIEVCAASGSIQFTLVGLPDQAVKEAKDRVITAIGNSGYKKIESNVTVNLAPANVRKEGPIYDLPIAAALLAATGKIECRNLADYALVGELALSGEVRRTLGILPIVLEMRRIGKKGILVPADNAAEAARWRASTSIPCIRSARRPTSFPEGCRSIRFARTRTCWSRQGVTLARTSRT